MEKILIVDDAEINREILKEIFEEQFEVIEAEDGQVAIEKIDEFSKDISVIFLDYIMPKKDGLEVLAYMRHKELLEHIPVIMITGEGTIDSDTKAYEYGAADIIHKPFASKIVTRRTMNLIEQYKSRNRMEDELRRKTKELMDSHERIEAMNGFLLDALGSVVEFKSLESGDHIKRVKLFTEIILNQVKSSYPEYGLTSEQVKLMSQAAALHDVGKIAISDEILNAPRKLTVDEFREVKKHSLYGCEILERFKLEDNDFFKYCYDICRWHHEKVDGAGYPDELVGDEIPIYCQAASLADCFDALISKRAYKSEISCLESFNMIVRGECGAFSEVILDCFEMAKLEIFMVADKDQKK